MDAARTPLELELMLEDAALMRELEAELSRAISDSDRDELRQRANVKRLQLAIKAVRLNQQPKPE